MPKIGKISPETLHTAVYTVSESLFLISMERSFGVFLVMRCFLTGVRRELCAASAAPLPHQSNAEDGDDVGEWTRKERRKMAIGLAIGLAKDWR